MSTCVRVCAYVVHICYALHASVCMYAGQYTYGFVQLFEYARTALSRLQSSMYICMGVLSIYICVCVYVYEFLCVCACVCMCVPVYQSVCAYACVCICMYVYVCVYMRVSSFKCVGQDVRMLCMHVFV